MKNAPSELKVCIIDNVPVVASRIQSILMATPNVTWIGTSNDLVSALSMVEARRPDVIIMDIHFGNEELKKGVALLNYLKQTYRQIKVIVFTNFADLRYRQLAMLNGADHFLDKATDSESIPSILDGIAKAKDTQ